MIRLLRAVSIGVWLFVSSTYVYVQDKQAQKDDFKQLARAFAPLVYVHQDERYFPYAVEPFMEQSQLYYNNAVVEKLGTVTPEKLATFNNRRQKHNLIPVSIKQKEVYAGFKPTADNNIQAPVYTHVYAVPGKKDYIIQYWFFYGLSGPPDVHDPTFINGVRAHIRKKQGLAYIPPVLIKTLDRLFASNKLLPTKIKKLIAEKATHEGDWEHVSVYIKQVPKQKDAVKIRNAYYILDKVHYAQHATGQMVPLSELELHKASHPVVYSALMTHASWPYAQPQINWLLDKAGKGYTWSTWDNIVLINPDYLTSSEQWVYFAGQWGKGNAPTGPYYKPTWASLDNTSLAKLEVSPKPLPGEKSRASKNFGVTSKYKRFQQVRVRVKPATLPVTFGINQYVKYGKDQNIFDNVVDGTILPLNKLEQNVYINRVRSKVRNKSLDSDMPFEVKFMGVY